MTRIQEAARGLIIKHRTVRKAADACGISYSLLWKLANGKQLNPTLETLLKLGLHTRTHMRKGNNGG